MTEAMVLLILLPFALISTVFSVALIIGVIKYIKDLRKED